MDVHVRFPKQGQKNALADSRRHLVVLRLEAERARHSAASGVGMRELEAQLTQQRLLGIESHDRLVMTVRLNDGFPLETRKRERRAFRHDELAERHH